MQKYVISPEHSPQQFSLTRSQQINTEYLFVYPFYVRSTLGLRKKIYCISLAFFSLFFIGYFIYFISNPAPGLQSSARPWLPKAAPSSSPRRTCSFRISAATCRPNRRRCSSGTRSSCLPSPSGCIGEYGIWISSSLLCSTV